MYKSFTADRLAICYSACNTQPSCQSFNYGLVDKICQFNNDTKYFQAKYFVEKATSVYADNPESGKLFDTLEISNFETDLHNSLLWSNRRLIKITASIFVVQYY